MLQKLSRLSLIASGAFVLTLVGALLIGAHWVAKPAALAAAVLLPIGFGSVNALRTFRFTAWILAAVVCAMLYPDRFLHVGSVNMSNKWLVLAVVQTVMFGMGAQMKLHDFVGVFKSPRGVFVGLAGHFTVMPLVGFGLTKLFHFPDEIAAGIILIGCCSSGLASNVMTYLAGGNLALSVTVTAITTLVAPVMTPLLVKLLASTLVEISFVAMMVEIVKIVLVPIAAALLHDYLGKASAERSKAIHVAAGVSALLLATLPLGGWRLLETHLAPGALTLITLAGFVLGALVFGVLYHRMTRVLPWLDRAMPAFSMAGIIYFTTVTTAAGRNNLLQVGALLFIASVIHNLAGYFFGYWISRGVGLDKQSCRSIAFEVGLQNGGMASGIAGSMGKLATMGLAAAIFSPWMNISGSILANIWRRMPIKSPEPVSKQNELEPVQDR